MLFHIVEKKKRSRPMSPKAQLEQEKRMRREIANSNERRRMQCINAGFQGLRSLMPQLSGEKLSKAAILQHTKEYIAKKEQELKQAKSQNEQLKRMLMEVNRDRDLAETPPPKRKKRDTECSDEGIGMCEPGSEGGATTTTLPAGKDMVVVGAVSSGSSSRVDDLHQELLDLRQQLDRERMLRAMMEERARNLEAQLVVHPPPPTTHHHHRISPEPILPPSSSPQTTSLPSPINLKVESPHSRPPCHNNNNNNSSSMQEISAHEDHRVQTHLIYDPKPNRNLENLVEAIRQIEGDRYVSSSSPGLGGDSSLHHSHSSHHSTLNCSEESEKESSVGSDPEESKSEGSGRDSPSPFRLCARSLARCVSAAMPGAATPQVAHQQGGILSDKYPIASHLLHRPPYYRPGVIVHKS